MLRPGGVFRFEPETLGRYAGGSDQQVWLPGAIGGFHGMTIFDRDIAGQRVEHYGLLVNCDGGGKAALDAIERRIGCMPAMSALTVDDMQSLRPFVTRAGMWTTRHPSFDSWPAWLSEAGFAETRVTYSGGWTAGRAFASTPKDARPSTLEELDALLGPMARAASQMPAPLPVACEDYILVTATKAQA